MIEDIEKLITDRVKKLTNEYIEAKKKKFKNIEAWAVVILRDFFKEKGDNKAYDKSFEVMLGKAKIDSLLYTFEKYNIIILPTQPFGINTKFYLEDYSIYAEGMKLSTYNKYINDLLKGLQD